MLKPLIPSLLLLENMKTLKSSVGAAASITQETRSRLWAELLLIYKGETLDEASPLEVLHTGPEEAQATLTSSSPCCLWTQKWNSKS